MKNSFWRPIRRSIRRTAIAFFVSGLFAGVWVSTGYAQEADALPVKRMAPPAPLLSKGHPVDWWFVFKFNAHSFPGCGEEAERQCPFGGEPQAYKSGFGQQFIYASSDSPALKKGDGCVGSEVTDPLGATFEQVYDSDDYFYAVWNDQFYCDPEIEGCTKECASPWGHSKGMLAWNEAGEGFVLQVSTPSWPASGNRKFSRKTDGNTLGCVIDDNVKVSQHFFSAKLDKNDLVEVLKALRNASVATDPQNSQIVRNGGPEDVQELVKALGRKSGGAGMQRARLSTGIELLSKPSHLHVPPWQSVSASLNGVPLRAATWWAHPEIPSTVSLTPISCWDDSLGKPGDVQIATSGHWEKQKIGLTGGPGAEHNHAKIGVSTDADSHYSIFADLNQQGALSESSGHKCSSSQNGRGGLFYILSDRNLFEGISSLLNGDTAPFAVSAPD